MAGLKAKFTKSLHGESEVDYTNFDNPVYELEPNFDAPSTPAAASQWSGCDALFGGKGDNRRRRWLIIGGVSIVLVVAIVVIAATVGSISAGKGPTRETTQSPTASESKGSTSYFGEMRLMGRSYTSVYDDPTSTQYIQLKAEFEKSMDEAITSEGLGDKYSRTEVINFKSGSIITVYEMTFYGHPTTKPEDLAEIIVTHINENGGNLGGFPVDVTSIVLSEGSLPTGSTKNPGTLKPSPITATSGKTETTRGGRPRTSPAPISTCGHPIIRECSTVLFYNSSRRPLAEQNRMKHALLQLANHTSACYSQSTFYMCTLIAPHCYGSSRNGSRNDDEIEFLLPCRQLCTTYKKECKEELIGVDTNEALRCNSYLPYTPRYPGRCTYTGTPPSVEVTTTVAPNTSLSEVCYPIHHTYCSNIPWRSAYLPNYMGHRSLGEAYDFLSFMQALQDSGMHCHDELHTLVCGTLLPKCDANYNRVPPCRSLCLDVLANCTLMLSNLPIHVPITCSLFTDDTNCTTVGDAIPPSGCNASTHYSCLDGRQCVDIGERCNGFPNCRDGSDERGCANNTVCDEGQFRCVVTGACIPSSWKCDSYNDCGDSTDEAFCECRDDQFQCTASDNTMRCINASQRCDGYYNCFSRQDELNCDNFTCRSDQFACANGLCRPLRFLCDGDDDCGDLSDEGSDQSCLAEEVCLESEFKCANGTRQWGIGYTSCVPHAWVCDTERDCSDGSDEKHCPSFCFPNPCSHGGTCTADVRGYLCECPPGTGGSNCQIVENLPEISCNTDIIIDACKAPLRSFHTKTIATNFTQTQVGPYIIAGLAKLENCYEYTTEFLCQYVVPQCGAIAFPVFPCKSMCLEFKASCAHKLNETEAIDRLIDCDTLLDDHHFPESECFKLNHNQPTMAPPPTSPPEVGCKELKVDYCKDLGYNSTFLPNFFNQTHQSSAEWLVDQFEYAHSSMPTCNPYLKHFGCAITVPSCNANGTAGIPPCRDLCEAVAFDCGYWMDHMQWRFPFTCDSLPLSNDSTVCVQLPPPVPKIGCYGDQFECGSGECIHKTFQCDGSPDCQDISDEESSMCEAYGCPLTHFDCGNNTCIPKSWVCDTDYDCPLQLGSDGPTPDEMNCQCDEETDKMCEDGAGCYSNRYHCDGYADCEDGSDESDASCGDDPHCAAHLYKCGSGECILLSWKCDGQEDCHDGTDEQECDYNCSNGYVKCFNGVNIYNNEPCLPVSWVCDAESDCSDGSDEEDCGGSCSESAPCLHGGQCVSALQSSGYTCTCPERTSGAHCEELIGLTSVQCNNPVQHAQCRGILEPHYSMTRVNSVIQSIVGIILTQDVLVRFNQCSPNIGPLTVCGTALPGCQDNGLPILPCKHMCTSFLHTCQDALTALGMTIDCSYYPDKSVYPDSVCISSPTDISTPPPVSPINQPKCETMKHSYCEQLYNSTIIPNLIGQTSQGEASVYVDIIEGIHTRYPLCHDALQLFSCAVLAPECLNGSADALLPCKQLCEEIKNNCSFELSIMQLPLQLECDDMPAYNGNILHPNCVTHEYRFPGCTSDAFRCSSGACIASSMRCDRSLDCADGSDEDSCPSVCNEEAFDCGMVAGRAACIPQSWRCDGVADCLGGADEENCPFACSELRREFSCGDGQTCLPHTKVCDYNEDCPDGDDEEDCATKTCSTLDFRCNSGKCIPESWVCDYVEDCPGSEGEDEMDCEDGVCLAGNFKCSNGGVNVHNSQTPCIPDHWVCDNEIDCNDGTDETGCGQEGNATCQSSPCYNGGSCQIVDSTISCSCPEGFSGLFCQTQDLPSYGCDHPLDTNSKCDEFLPYSTTSSSLHIQSLLNMTTEFLLYTLNASQCYDLAPMFVCATRYPTCQSNGFPLLPCRHICYEFLSRCNHVIIGGGYTDLRHINCSSFVTSDSSVFTCLDSSSVMPPPKLLTVSPQTNYTCEPINNTFCSSLDYTLTVALPNHFGQTTQAEAAYLINLLTTLQSNSECKRQMSLVGCALAFPKCSETSQPLPPCRQDCLDALENCEFFFQHFQLELPVDCNSFPDSEDPMVCLHIPPPEIPPQHHCKNGTRLCVHSSECVASSTWCDTEVNCLDASDEENCDVNSCSTTAVLCPGTYNQCIPHHWVCDGDIDCQGAEDELQCQEECGSNEFQCLIGSVNVGSCIPLTWRCDGEVDCFGGNGEDEIGCQCTEGQFQCGDSSSRCIPQRWVCDSIEDCDDGSDESATADCSSSTLSTRDWWWWGSSSSTTPSTPGS